MATKSEIFSYKYQKYLLRVRGRGYILQQPEKGNDSNISISSIFQGAAAQSMIIPYKDAPKIALSIDQKDSKSTTYFIKITVATELYVTVALY